VTGVPIVLFLCVHNAGRSQMALGWFRHLAGDRAVGLSGGSEPAGASNPVVVTMGCGDACPYVPATRYEDWPLDDPAGQDLSHVRPIRDEIGRRVRGLLASLAIDC